ARFWRGGSPMEKVGWFKLFGIPEAVSAPIVLAALAFMLAPLTSELDFGVVKIPKITTFPYSEFVGVLILLILLSGYLPIFRHTSLSVPTKNFNSSVEQLISSLQFRADAIARKFDEFAVKIDEQSVRLLGVSVDPEFDRMFTPEMEPPPAFKDLSK